MRTISLRLDDTTEDILRRLCALENRTQTEIVKIALESLARHARPSPAVLAAKHGLVGGFASTEGDLAAGHSRRVKERLRSRRAAGPSSTAVK